MVYDAFLTKITEALQTQLGEDYRIILQKIPKNNGTVLDGLCISKATDRISPTIYLKDYYEHYKDGTPFHQVLNDIIEVYTTNRNLPPVYPEHLLNFEHLQSKIVYKLIHTESNEAILPYIPYIPYLDLSIVFYLLLEENEHGQMTALIHNSSLNAWEITVDDLYAIAAKNTPLLLPVDLKDMTAVMKEIASDRLGEDYQEDFIDQLFSASVHAPLYVLSNRSNLRGACAILYEHVLKNFADSLGQDLVILPSSIHEVLLIPYDEDVCFKELAEMVTHINETEVPPEDRLSNEVYFYSRVFNQVTLASPAAQAEYLS